MSSCHGVAGRDPVPAHPWDQWSTLQDRLASWLLGWPLTAFLSSVCIFMLATWIPHYVTWPWFCDHDHFAQVAQLWNSGTARPYRDVFTFQFPGEIYVFLVLGKLFGWGNSIAFYAFDAIVVVVFGVLLSLWSRRLFGQIAPGLVGYSFFLYFYLGLDYHLAAQRDWHAAFLALLGLLLSDILPDRRGRIASGAAFGLSLVFRPQMLLLFPALCLSIDHGARSSKGPARRTFVALLQWAVGAVAAILLGLLPLAADGLIPDFLKSLDLAISPTYRGSNLFRSANPLFELPRLTGFVLVPLMVCLLFPRNRPDLFRRACEIAVALGGIALYKAASPVYFAYHEIPQIATLTLAIVFMAGMIRTTSASPRVQIALLLLLFMFAMPHCPRFALVKLEPPDWQSYGVLEAFPLIRSGEASLLVPPGFDDRQKYRWFEVRDMVSYLRKTTSATTPVANLLFDSVTAVAGAIPRLSALPIDNKLLYCFPEHVGQVEEALEQNEQCVVVWNPSDSLWLSSRIQPLKRTIEQHYRRDTHFGLIEVWRRLPRQISSPSPGQAACDSSTTSYGRPCVQARLNGHSPS